MPYDDVAYHNWYNSQNYDRISFFVPKGTRERIKSRAKATGKSMNGYLIGLLPQDLITEREFVRRTKDE